ncbi:MAG: hypothetical protein CVU84_16555 [Firmicutes bacterium HGW-Firmicutes-1]|jgi:transcriptional antiterminator|nr:MAG: hypothetical protein CVU84_16555 [Firmicutes bacterium HGW-Firmicutes-1]
MEHKYEIAKIMNNNVILVRRIADDLESVLIGKGLGFQKKCGTITTIPTEQIEKAFFTYDEKLKNDYHVLFRDMDSKVFGTCAELVSLAEKKLGELSPKLLIVLTDHISFALERIKMGMEIENPFIYEIKNIYPEEYAIAQMGRDLFINSMGIDISEDEVGFIAWHLNAGKQNKNVAENVKSTRLIKAIIETVEKRIDYTLDVNSTSYNRFINHLKGLVFRTQHNENIVNPLQEAVRLELTDAYNIALEVKKEIKNGAQLTITDDELAYLAIHINRLQLLSKIQNS